MDYFPIHLDLRGQPCLVVGGGQVAYRKICALLKSGAVVTVVSPAILPEIKEVLSTTEGSCIEAPYAIEHITNKRLVVAATNQSKVNQRVAKDVVNHGQLVNVVDDQTFSNCIIPAVIDRSPLIFSISSGGKAPVLSRIFRAKLEALVPARYGQLAELMGDYREKVKSRFPTVNLRRQFWEKLLESSIAELVLAGKRQTAKAKLEVQLAQSDTVTGNEVGEVYLVGAGPGDPDLLTFKALRLMQKADVVLYDRLVSNELLDLVRRDCERIFVGKTSSRHTVPQSEINQTLVRLAKAGRRVCRLKGGDPFIFGRGGEEIGSLVVDNIPFQVVPGITAASGCASYAGIPLTHRDYSQSVRFVTGHLKEGAPELNWQNLITHRETLVIYMGLGGMPLICQRLQEHGMSGEMPIALIEHGTTKKQRVVTGQLSTFADKVAQIEAQLPIESPALLIVGEVVMLRQTLSWYSPEKDSC